MHNNFCINGTDGFAIKNRVIEIAGSLFDKDYLYGFVTYKNKRTQIDDDDSKLGVTHEYTIGINRWTGISNISQMTFIYPLLCFPI